jgi:hypothetical protein
MASQFLEKKNKSEVVGDTEKDIQARKSIMVTFAFVSFVNACQALNHRALKAVYNFKKMSSYQWVLQMAYEAFCQHLESNGGLGKNEDVSVFRCERFGALYATFIVTIIAIFFLCGL